MNETRKLWACEIRRDESNDSPIEPETFVFWVDADDYTDALRACALVSFGQGVLLGRSDDVNHEAPHMDEAA